MSPSDASPPVLPKHVAIIMDGNGRWAKARGLPRIKGHAQGAETVRAITRECARRHLGQLTLYAFSVENWKRPSTEVAYLMRLLRKFLEQEHDEIMDNNIRLTSIGRIHELPPEVRKALERERRASEKNTGMTLCLALNYGGRTEIVDAARRLAEEAHAGRLRPDRIDEREFTRRLYDPEMPDPDLLIRTAGELRLSNFLLWQGSYAEFWVTPVCWPEFTVAHLEEAFRSFASRERRFGGL
ncbi:MAG: isoprenyl transferase [Planctomycetes bacterium]|nr:isoprenyl transferase [Planctomycetota bacterium]